MTLAPEVRLARPQPAEADGGEGHEAEVDGVVETPVLEMDAIPQLGYISCQFLPPDGSKGPGYVL